MLPFPKGELRMKTSLLLLSCIMTAILTGVTVAEIDMPKAIGSSVIAAKSHIKGGETQRPIVLPPNLTAKQAENLAWAYKVAKADGHRYPEYYQGLIYQESRAGGMKGYQVAGHEFGLGPMKRYYGVPQIKLAAAKDVLAKYPSLGKFNTDEEIIAKLIMDDKWSIQVGSKYLLIVGNNKDIKSALVAYNRGEAGAKGVDPNTYHYSTGISKHVNGIVNTANKLAMRTS